MEPESDRIKGIFEQALERKSPAERNSFLAGVCNDQPELRREIESLLHGQTLSCHYRFWYAPSVEQHSIVQGRKDQNEKRNG
jgi:hypothetical protein